MRLNNPLLEFWVDVKLISRDGRWLAVAMLSGEPEIGIGNSLPEAIENSLSSLGHYTAALLAEAAETD
jgi:hypothetical protein